MNSQFVNCDKQKSYFSYSCFVSPKVRDEIDSLINSQNNSLSNEAREALSSLIVKSSNMRMSESQNRRSIAQSVSQQPISTTNKIIRSAVFLIGGFAALYLLYTIAKHNGYAQGYADSIKEGTMGYENGKRDGISIGRETGYNNGKKDGYSHGINVGCDQLRKSMNLYKYKILELMDKYGIVQPQIDQVVLDTKQYMCENTLQHSRLS